IGGAKDGAAEMTDAGDGNARELGQATLGIGLGLEQTVVPVANAPAFPAMMGPRHHHRPDHRVQSWGIAAPGVDRDLSNLGHRASHSAFLRSEPSMVSNSAAAASIVRSGPVSLKNRE